MKYTLKCEQFNYNNFNGNEEDVNTTITHEFRAESLTEMLENFEMFLRGSGFHFDGYIDVVPHEEIVNDKTEEEQFNIHKDWDRHINSVKMYTVHSSLEKCSVCTIEKDVMKTHECFDKNCPKDTW